MSLLLRCNGRQVFNTETGRWKRRIMRAVPLRRRTPMVRVVFFCVPPSANFVAYLQFASGILVGRLEASALAVRDMNVPECSF